MARINLQVKPARGVPSSVRKSVVELMKLNQGQPQLALNALIKANHTGKDTDPDLGTLKQVCSNLLCMVEGCMV